MKLNARSKGLSFIGVNLLVRIPMQQLVQAFRLEERRLLCLHKRASLV